MRLVAWNCNMALDRKVDRLLALNPDIAVISECAEPARLRARGADWIEGEPVWVGRNLHKRATRPFVFCSPCLQAHVKAQHCMAAVYVP